MILDVKALGEKANDLQLKTIIVIQDLFSNYLIKNMSVQYSDILGSRGDFDGKKMLEILIKFNVSVYLFEIYLYYDQIEYYINDEKGNTVAECNIEDFYSIDEMILKYKNYLKKDISKLLNKEATI